MGIWVRSQDRRDLINTKRIEVDGFKIYAFQELDDGYLVIGRYETEERALGILDTIQEMILRNDGHNFFLMPEK